MESVHTLLLDGKRNLIGMYGDDFLNDFSNDW